MRSLYAFAAVLAVTQPVLGNVSFNFTYSDSAGSGFNDASLGTARKAALAAAANSLATYFPSYTATVSITVSSFVNAASLNLANGSSPYSISSAGFKETVLQHLVLTGSDLNGGGSTDGNINFNFGQSWSYTDSVSGSQYDFKSVAMHELMHAFGFFSLISSTGTGGKSLPSGSADVWTVFDKFVTDGTGRSLVKSDFKYDTSIGTAPLTGNPGMYFNGPNAVAAYGASVPLYSPSTWLAGSSGSHLDDNTFSGVNHLLMDSTTSTGLGNRSLSSIEQGILKDLGFAVVPEPQAWFGAMGGLAFAAIVVHRRRTGSSPATTE